MAKRNDGQRGRGRPPLDDPRHTQVLVRLTAAECAALERLEAASGLTRGEIVGRELLRAAKRIRPK